MRGSKLRQPAREKKKQKQKQRMSRLGSPPRVSFQDPVGHSLPESLQGFRWNVDKVERKLQEKIQEKTKIAGNFVYQQAYRLLECSRGDGIDFLSFKEQLRIKFGIILEDHELQLLFDKYDEDRNGTIDLHEFIRRVLPSDYNYGKQWFEISQLQGEEKQARLRREARQEFLLGMGVPLTNRKLENLGEATNWTMETLMKQIQAKVVQKTPGGDDQYRRAFKMLRSGRDQGIRMKELRNNLKNKFGIFISEQQMKELFSQFDADGSGEIDLQEFLQFVEPPAYPRNSCVPNGIWTQQDSSDEDEDGSEEGEGSSIASSNERQAQDSLEQQFAQWSLNSNQRAPEHRQMGDSHLPPAHSMNVHWSRKERPKSANPKKSAMLQQRRAAQQLQQQRQFASAAHLMTAKNAGIEVDHDLLAKCLHPLSRSKQTNINMSVSKSLADIHGSDNLEEHPQNGSLDEACDPADNQSGAHVLRPRSAGSVCSSRAPSSIGSSVASSVRGAAYMKRPSTAQHLRQKCLESRLAGTANEARKLLQRQKRASIGPTVNFAETDSMKAKSQAYVHDRKDRERRRSCPSESNSSVYNLETNKVTHTRAHHCQDRHTTSSCGDASPTRSVGVQSDQSYLSTDSDFRDYNVPRVVQVHPKQHDTRPFSRQGKVLRRNKLHSTGCR